MRRATVLKWADAASVFGMLAFGVVFVGFQVLCLPRPARLPAARAPAAKRRHFTSRARASVHLFMRAPVRWGHLGLPPFSRERPRSARMH